MKSLKLYLTISFIILILSSCSDAYYSDYKSVEGYRWWKSDIKSFEFEIKEQSEFDLIYTMRYITAFPYQIIKVHVEIQRPDGKIDEKDILMRTVGEDGKYIGEVAGDMWDFQSPISEKETLAPGKYKVSLKQDMPDDPMVALMTVGVEVRKHESDSKK